MFFNQRRVFWRLNFRWVNLRVGVTLLSASLLMGGAGCGIKFAQKPSDAGTVQLGSADTACLNGAFKTLGDYFRGGASGVQISGLYNCAANSLVLFQQRVTSAELPLGQYSPKDLRKFLEQYFLGGLKISDGLLNNVMLLKVTLLGGGAEVLTQNELNALVNLLYALRDQSVNLQPFFPISAAHFNSMSRADLITATNAFKKAANALSATIEENATPYDFNNLTNLLKDLQGFLEDPAQQQEVATIISYIPLFREVKSVVVSSGDQEMMKSDWRVLLTTGSALLSSWAKFSHTLANQSNVIYGTGLDELLHEDAREVISVLGEILARNPQSTISYCRIYSLIDQIGKLWGQSHLGDPPDDDYIVYFNVGGNFVYKGTIKSLLQPLFQRYLRPTVATTSSEANFPIDQACNAPYVTQGLKQENVDRFWDGIRELYISQKMLEYSFNWAGKNAQINNPLSTKILPNILLGWNAAGSSKVDQASLLNLLDSGTTTTDVVNYIKSAGESSEQVTELIMTGARSMFDTLTLHRPLFSADDLQINFNGNPGEQRTDFSGATFLNGIRLLGLLAWNGYIADPARATPTGLGMSKLELQSVYNDIREIGNALRIFDPTSPACSTGPNAPSCPSDQRFLEAKIFTFSSYQNEALTPGSSSYMNLNEGQDYIGYLVSAGNFYTRAYYLMHDKCAKWNVGCEGKPMHVGLDGVTLETCNVGGVDIYGREKITAACYNHWFDSTAWEPAQAPSPSPGSAPEATSQGSAQAGVVTYTSQIWDHLPRNYNFWLGLPSQGSAPRTDTTTVYKETYRCILTQAGGLSDPKGEWVDSGDLQTWSALQQYIESLFARFDLDNSDTINKAEARAAYQQALGDELKAAASRLGLVFHFFGFTFPSSDTDYESVLDFLLSTGRMPNGLGDDLDIISRRLIYDPNYKANRATIYQIVAVLVGHSTTSCFAMPAGSSAPQTVPVNTSLTPQMSSIR